MPGIIDYLLSPASFVHIATLCYVLGLLTRKELVLRVFILTGTVFYILYYYHVADHPLWEAIFASILIGSANLPVIWRIFRERSTWGMSDEMLSLFRSFPNLNPGQFRTMMKNAEIMHDCPETVLLEEGVVSGKLFLSITNGFVVMRGTQHAEIGPRNFLGEISFLLAGPATADVVARKGSSYVVWEARDLRQIMAHKPAMANAITVLLNKDIARKLAGSFPTRATSFLPDNLT
ncbi:MAG: hypothetical protein WA782_11805 [Sulfitobacter sp.]